ncbi:MAG: alpha/beta hydrolase [Bacteroidetes bacterium]|nr:alpha/beta hydrolase [Bacteroidota bacterium]
MNSSFIVYKHSRLAYRKYGEGKKIVLLFHGFGQDNKAFQSWADAWQREYTLYSFDLFFHGESTWLSSEPVEKKDWTQIITTFIHQEQVSEFEVVGFSLGGKFALATVEALPQKVKRIVLLAADGIKPNFWYRLATYPYLMRVFFKSLILHPGRFHRVTKLLRALHLVDKGVIRFAESQMDTEEKRKRVYDSWVGFRHLNFDIKTIANVIIKNKIDITILVGKYDKIVSANDMTPMLKRVAHCTFHILETGHNGVVEKALEFLRVKNT